MTTDHFSETYWAELEIEKAIKRLYPGINVYIYFVPGEQEYGIDGRPYYNHDITASWDDPRLTMERFGEIVLATIEHFRDICSLN